MDPEPRCYFMRVTLPQVVLPQVVMLPQVLMLLHEDDVTSGGEVTS